VNIRVTRKPPLETLPEVQARIQDVEKAMGERGRILVRYSGTEPVCRVMIEGEDQAEIDAHADALGELIQKTLN
jgi:phosphoglucosamine mutase